MAIVPYSDTKKYALPIPPPSLPSGATRLKLPSEENVSVSVKDVMFSKERERHDLEATNKTQQKKSLQVKPSTQRELDSLTDPVKLINDNKEAFCDHLEARIHAFILQIINCYNNVDLHFTIGKTEEQMEPTSRISIKTTKGLHYSKGSSKTIPLNAAHQGTLPLIYAYPKDEWDEWKEEDDYKAKGKPNAEVFLKNSDAYFANNACSGIMKLVNEADIQLDGNTTEKIAEFGKTIKKEDMKLRQYAIGLINRAAQTEIGPVKGLNLFMKKLRGLVKDLKDEVPSEKMKAIFKIWDQCLDELEEQYEGHYSDLIINLLGVEPPAVGDANEKELRKLILSHHYDIIQKKEFCKSAISAFIDELEVDILDLSNKKPNKFDLAFKYALMKEAFEQDDVTSGIFQRWYNCNGSTLKQLKSECETTYNPALTLVSKPEAQAKIKAFFVKFKKYMHNFSVDEAKFSANLLQKLRSVRDLSEKKFVARYNKTFKDSELSLDDYREMESGETKIEPEIAENFATLLKVDSGILTPGLFLTR